MFSRREREYLLSLAPALPEERRPQTPDFSPGYRRKLRWSIRRKAQRAAADWALFAGAARQESSLLPATLSSERERIPLYTEPAAEAVAYFGRKLRRSGEPRRKPDGR